MNFAAFVAFTVVYLATSLVEATEENNFIDGILEQLYQKMPEPMFIPDTSNEVKDYLINYGTIELKNTSVFGLSNFTLINNVTVIRNAKGRATYNVTLRIDNVKITTKVHPNLGHLLRITRPFPAEMNIGIIQIRLQLIMYGKKISFFNLPKVVNFFIEKFQQAKVHLKGKQVLLDRIAELLTNSLIKHLNRNIRQLVSEVLQKKITQILNNPASLIG